jgi:hypothetical protein
VYVGPRARAGSAAFAAQYGERLSAAAVVGDASRCIHRLCPPSASGGLPQAPMLALVVPWCRAAVERGP